MNSHSPTGCGRFSLPPSEGERARVRGLFGPLLALAVCAGCAAIPKEAVTLSERIGNGVQTQSRAHVNLVNLFFEHKKSALDRWMENEYTPKYLANIRAELKKAGENPDLLTDKMAADIVRDIVQERDRRHAELEKARVALLTRVEKNYSTLSRANAQLTGLLQSAVDVKDATREIEKTLTGATGLDIDFESIEKKFDEYLINAGNIAGKGKSFYDEIKPIIEE